MEYPTHTETTHNRAANCSPKGWRDEWAGQTAGGESPVREHSVLKSRPSLMDVGRVEEIWLAGGHKRAFSCAWSSWKRTDTLQQQTCRRLRGAVAGKVSGIFWDLFINLVSPVDFGWSERRPKSCLLSGMNTTSSCACFWNSHNTEYSESTKRPTSSQWTTILTQSKLRQINKLQPLVLIHLRWQNVFHI